MSNSIKQQTKQTKTLSQRCYYCNVILQICSTSTESYLCQTICRDCINNSTWKSQSGVFSEATHRDLSSRCTTIKTWLYEGSHQGESFTEHYINVPDSVKPHVNLIEDILLLSHHMLLSRNTFDRYIAIINFCKLRGSRLSMSSSILYVLGDIFGDNVAQYRNLNTSYETVEEHVRSNLANEFTAQADENIFAEARAYLGVYDKLKETAIYKKLHQFTMYILVLDLFKGINIDFDSLNYKKFEIEAIKKSFRPGVDMCMSMIDTILFVCDRGLHYFNTGDKMAIFHSGHSYETWLTDSKNLIRDSANSALINSTERFKFLSDLKHNIEKGRGIVKFTGGIDRFEKMTLTKTLWDLESIQVREMTRRAALETRKDPFAILVHGSSSICKSQLKQILYYHYGKYFNLPVTTEYCYTRMPFEEFWTGFLTSMWCVVMDDIAFLRPNGGEVDPTLKEMLQVKNSVPYCPPQAALEDKGHTPLRNELLIGTTNTKSLNLNAYFACPFAIARRLPYILTCTVKPEFAKHKIMADSQKIPITPEGEYMNIWNFVVTVPQPAVEEDEDNQRTKYQVIERFSDINDMLAWYIKVAKEHNCSQEKALSADRTMLDVKICQGCGRTARACNCEFTPVSEDDLSFSAQNEIDETIIIPEENIELPNNIDGINLDEYSSIFRIQLWFFAHILAPATNPLPEIPISYGNKAYISFVWFMVMLFNMKMILPTFLLSVCVYIYIHLWFILANTCFIYYGDFWKLKLAMKLFSSKWEATKFIFRLGGDRIYRKWYSLPQLRMLKRWLIPSTAAIYMLWRGYQNIKAGSNPEKVIPGTNYHERKLAEQKIKEDKLSEALIAQKGLNSILINQLNNMDSNEDEEFSDEEPLTERELAMENCVSELTHRLPSMRKFTKKQNSLMKKKVVRDSIIPKKMQQYRVNQQFNVQANEGTIPIPMEEEKPAFYYHDPYQTTEVDISQASMATPFDIVNKQLQYNTARIEFVDLNQNKSKGSIAINIKGQLWLVNNHSVDDEFNCINIILDDITQNVSRNCYRIFTSKKDFTHIPNTDLCIFKLTQIPPGHNLFKYLPKMSLEGCYKGIYNIISKNGSRSVIQIDNIRKGSCPIFNVPGHFGTASELTVSGNCGAMCIASVGNAPVLFGMHTAGNDNKIIFFQDVTQNLLESYISNFVPQVEFGVLPISAPGYERKLGPVDNKSHIRWALMGHATVMGCFLGWRAKIKSKVVPTFICDSVTARGYKNEYGPPNMTWKPWSLAIQDMTSITHLYDTTIIDECVTSFSNDILRKVSDKLHLVQVYTQEVALNGVDGVTYVDRINTRTSAGNPFRKSKKNFITLDSNNKIIALDKVIQDRISDIETAYSAGIRYNPQFCAHIKDDPTTKKKHDMGKSRIFTGGEFAWSVVVRKYYLSHIRLIQNNPFVFEAMPGIVAQSTEWTHLYDYITTFGKDNMIAGDYAKFDKKMAAPFILAAFEILINISKAAGWSDEDLLIMRCIAHDTAFSNIDFNGTYIMIQGNPSGHPLTVIINCLVNSLYIRYAYKKIYGGSLEYLSDKIKIATYGDDNVLNVHDDYKLFNHTSLAAELKKIGVDYTMADKTSESIPFINIDQISFLKRSFRFDNDVGAILAPLEPSSFDKMLTSRVMKSHLCAEAHAIAVIETALREYFFYGKDVYNEKTAMFYDIINENNLNHWIRDSTFPSYDSLCYDFWIRSGNKLKARKFAVNGE